MRKALTYSGFAIAGLVVVAVFVTARTYTQLGGAILIYPLLAYLAFELFIRNPSQKPTVSVQSPPIKKAKIETETTNTEKEGVSVVDIDKRAFLKLIGVAGLSFFLFSLLSRRSEALFFGKAAGPASGATTLEDSSGKTIDPSENHPTDGYRISEIDENDFTFYGFTNNQGGWFIMKENSDSGSFRYSKGDADFPRGWNSREHLKYDYFHEVFS